MWMGFYVSSCSIKVYLYTFVFGSKREKKSGMDRNIMTIYELLTVAKRSLHLEVKTKIIPVHHVFLWEL